MRNEVEYKITDKINRECINEIIKVHEDKGLTAENLLDAARNENSSLHRCFDWNDSEAAEKWRLQQARILINEIKVIIENKEYYAFENVSVLAPSLNGSSIEYIREYKPIVEIMSQEDLRNQVIAAALRHHQYWEVQNSKYSELLPIIKAASKVRMELSKK